MITDVGRVFYIEQHEGTINYRRPARNNPVVIESLGSIGTLRETHLAHGIGSTDFGMFVDVIDQSGNEADMESFLVTQTLGRNSGIIVPSDDVLKDPRKHFSKELARKIAVLAHGELDCFGLNPLGDYVRKNYQDMRALR